VRARHAVRAEGAGAQGPRHDANLAGGRELRRSDPRGQWPGPPLRRDHAGLGLGVPAPTST
jgi:hypothetical protein